MFCGQCGTKLSDDDKFCTSCGAPVKNRTEAVMKLEKTDLGLTKSVRETNTPVQNTTQPIRAAAINNVFFVLLVFAPLISTCLMYFVAASLFIKSSLLWWFPYVINTILCFADLQILKHKGFNTKSISKFFIIVPVYIFRRARLVNGKKWLSTIVWTVVFVVCLIIPLGFWARVFGPNPSVIDLVQKGTLNQYPDATVEEILTATIDDCKWDTYYGSNYRVLVQAKGYIEGKQMDVLFCVCMNNTFYVSSVTGFNVRTDEEIVEFIDRLYQRYKENIVAYEETTEETEINEQISSDTENSPIPEDSEKLLVQQQDAELTEPNQVDNNTENDYYGEMVIYKGELPEAVFNKVKGHYVDESGDTVDIDLPKGIVRFIPGGNQSHAYYEQIFGYSELSPDEYYIYVESGKNKYTYWFYSYDEGKTQGLFLNFEDEWDPLYNNFSYDIQCYSKDYSEESNQSVIQKIDVDSLNKIVMNQKVTIGDLMGQGYQLSLFLDHTKPGMALAYRIYEFENTACYAVVYDYDPETYEPNEDEKVYLIINSDNPDEDTAIYDYFESLWRKGNYPIG